FDSQHERLFVGGVEDIVAGLLLEALGQEFAQKQVHVVPAKLADALAADLLEDAVVNAKNGHVQCAAAKVVNQHGLIFLRIQAVTDGSCRRLVDERQHLQAGGAGTKLG